MKVGYLLIIWILGGDATSLPCPSIPDVSMYIIEANEKLTEACDEVVDYYISEVSSDESKEIFVKGLQEASSPNFNESQRILRRARSIAMRSTGTSTQNFSSAFNNGGFMQSPLNCFNKVLWQLRVEEEKLKIEYESLVSRLTELFEFYLSRRKRSKKSGQLNSPSVVTSTRKPSADKIQPTTKNIGANLKTTKVKKIKPTTKKTKPTTLKPKTTKKKVGSAAPQENRPPKTTLPPFKTSPTLQTSSSRIVPTSTIIQTTSSVISNLTTSTIKCPRIRDIQSYLNIMSERTSDICEKSKFFYIDYVERNPTMSFSNGLRQRIFHHEKAFNVSFNNTFDAVRSATGVSLNDFRIAYDNGGFFNSPLSCFNSLIMKLKIEHVKLVGRVEGVKQQLGFLFAYYEKNV